MAVDNSGQIQANSLQPQEAHDDAGGVTMPQITQQIAGDRYANAAAGAKTRNRGFRFSKLIPAGPMPDQQGTNPSSAPRFDGI